jgi:hypothetical protein
VIFQGVGVDLRDDERDVRVEPEVASVVYDDGAARDRLARELDRGALLPLRPGEKGDVHALERVRLGDADLELLAGENGPPGAAGEDAQLL